MKRRPWWNVRLAGDRTEAGYLVELFAVCSLEARCVSWVLNSHFLQNMLMAHVASVVRNSCRCCYGPPSVLVYFSIASLVMVCKLLSHRSRVGRQLSIGVVRNWPQLHGNLKLVGSYWRDRVVYGFVLYALVRSIAWFIAEAHARDQFRSVGG